MFFECRVIPASTVSAVIINEGLHGWNVRYYLAVITKVEETQSLHVMYEVKTFTPIGSSFSANLA